MRVANKDCREYVIGLKEFKGSNMFSENDSSGRFYVVYSYGHHFPMYVYDRDRMIWIYNNNKYSRSNSKQHSQACPCVSDPIHLPKADILKLLRNEW